MFKTTFIFKQFTYNNIEIDMLKGMDITFF